MKIKSGDMALNLKKKKPIVIKKKKKIYVKNTMTSFKELLEQKLNANKTDKQ